MQRGRLKLNVNSWEIPLQAARRTWSTLLMRSVHGCYSADACHEIGCLNLIRKNYGFLNNCTQCLEKFQRIWTHEKLWNSRKRDRETRNCRISRQTMGKKRDFLEFWIKVYLSCDWLLMQDQLSLVLTGLLIYTSIDRK